MKRAIILFVSIMLFVSVNLSSACVGRTIYIGQEKNPESMILTEMLAILIRERTGTTAVLKVLKQNENGHDMLEKGDIDIFVEYTGKSFVEVLKRKDILEKDKVSEIVRQEYQKRLNLVWLEPFGFESKIYKLELPCCPAPVIRKQTIKNFPALPRLLNKLGGIVDDKVRDELLEKVNNSMESITDIAREFLKWKKLI